MQTLHTSVNVVEGLTGFQKHGGSWTHGSTAFEGRFGPSLPRRATVSRRSLKKRCCNSGVKLRQHRPVEASWSGSHHRPTSPLFGATILSWVYKSSNAGRSWIRSVSSPPRDNLDTTDQFQEPGTSDPSKEAESTSQTDNTSFDWKSNWYPVFPVIDADKTIPHAFQILGRKVVIWYDKEAAVWRTFLDMCPHRLAPFSEGRIDEQGCIQCCYHGWSFKGDGSCARIPQALGEGPEAKAARNNMARCVSFPTVVKQGMLFVWPDANGHELAKKTEPPVTPGIEDEGWYFYCTFRDLDHGYDTGMENLVDPSHVPVAHHGVNGGVMGKREMAAPIELEVTSQHPRGFEGQWNKPHGGKPSRHVFDAPARFTYRFFLKQPGAAGCTTTYCTPMAPGKCRILVINARNFMTQLSSGPEWWQLFPRWLDHQMMLNIFDGDLTLLHEQERNLRDVTNGHVEKWNKAFFMPTKADRYVGAFRQWLSRHGGNGVPYVTGSTLPPLVTKREDLLDRYHSHTKQCMCCSGALEGFKRAQTALYLVAGACIAVGAALAPTSQLRYLAVAVGVVSALLAWYFQSWIQMFYYKGWNHARLA
ncbi:hypothetical protein KC19_2G056900 [Ceratodon purpureus]|uniref:Rieske domain-containing protein n=1 Tax=Ceratodon purpureus TaxID=3225 RepID=A0A8T0ITA4_CERPU|nr:hypothetical protein KC19_2G056900 [Ceratodon purpureus]